MPNDNFNLTAMEPNFGTGMVVALVTFASTGIAANAASACYIFKTFPYRKIAIFFLALVDSVVCFIGNALFLAVFIASLYRRDKYICILRNFLRMFQTFSGTLITFQIAATRLISVRMSQSWKQVSERHAFQGMILVYFLHALAFTYRLGWQSFFEMSVSTAIDICMGLPGHKPPADWRTTLIIIWLVALPLATVLANALTLVLIKVQSMSKIYPSKVSKTPAYTIPLKATLLSTAFLVAMIFVVVALRKLNLSREIANGISTAASVATNAARCPLMTAMAFSAKVRADLESKEKRQERVRDWASQERQTRNELSMNVISITV